MEKKDILLIIIIVLLIVVGAVGGWMLLRQEKMGTERANAILQESMQKTLELDSYTMTGNMDLRVKDGETILFEIGIKDSEMSFINPFDFANQNSSMAFTYNVMINLEAIINLIKAGKTEEELEKLKEPDPMLGINYYEIMKTARAIGKANILLTIETKSINFDSYTRIVKVEGLREFLTDVGGVFVADMAMKEIESIMGVWKKTPADPAMKEGMITMFKPIQEIIPSFFDIYYVKEVLPNTRINGMPVYNFVTDIDWTKTKDVLISLIRTVSEKQEMFPKDLQVEKEELIVKIRENWPIVKKVIDKAIEINSVTYIDQRTRFILKDRAVININLPVLMRALKEIAPTEERTPEEIAEFEKMKERMKNMNIVITMNLRYTDHNAVPAITPPAEYQLIEPGIMPMFPSSMDPVPKINEINELPIVNTNVLLRTNRGEIKIELFDKHRPITVGNFVSLIERDFYDGLIFHRVINGFMIQGGCPYGTGFGSPGHTIKCELEGDNRNTRGTISMANAGPNTGGSQFFINLVDNNFLDTRHSVFGRAIKGMDVVDAIGRVQTGPGDRPIQNIIIKDIKIMER